MNIENISQKLQIFADERDWKQFHSVKNLAMALSVESSELLEIFQWMKEEDSNLVKDNSQLKERVSEEVADVFMYLLKIADAAEIDLEKAVLSKLEKNALKYPAEQARGNSKKYSELKGE